MQFYVCVFGGRGYSDRETMSDVLTFLHRFYREDLRLIHGAAPGADRLAGEIAAELGIKVREFPADWDTLGKAAGFVRNAKMADYLRTMRDKHGFNVAGIAFPGGNGTADMAAKLEDRDIHVDHIGVPELVGAAR